LDLPNPPPPRLTLDIGITGHRASVLSPELVEIASPIVERVLTELRLALDRIHAEEQAIFSPDRPHLRLHTPLATGADQMAATIARAAGYHVRALLPLSAADYREDFEKGPERREFSKQLATAQEVFALAAEQGEREAAYVQVGRAVVAASDVLIAVWDGNGANGPGGTAHVVDLALNSSVPVIHVPINRAAGTAGEPRLLFGRDIMEFEAEALDNADQWTRLLRETLLPQGAVERLHVATYYAERERTSNWRIEYPLLLAMLGIKRLPSRPWRQSSIAADIEHDWENVQGQDPAGARETLAHSYGWANFLAIRYAQLFRSGHITNYVLSALAVNLALFGLIVPQIKILLVVAELCVIGLLFLNTRAGTRGDWHRKWLQYRYLAETLRPLIYLKRCGLIGPPFRSDFVRGPLHRQAGADWTRWYAAAVWRQMDWPTGELTQSSIHELAENVVTEQLLPQASYHKVNAERMHKLDHRLHEIGNFLMGAVIASCFLYIVTYFMFHEWAVAATGAFIFLTAGLPAISAAVFGMRGHGEHLLAASRSAHTVAALTANAQRLRQANKLDKLSAELETSAAIMLSDLNEWTATYRERSLEIPG
jgi:hypothetical protein